MSCGARSVAYDNYTAYTLTTFSCFHSFLSSIHWLGVMSPNWCSFIGFSLDMILGVSERIGEKNPCVFGLVVTINLYVLVACLKKSSFYADIWIYMPIGADFTTLFWWDG